MTPLTMSLARVLCPRPYPTKDVHLHRYDFKMVWIHTVSHAAQMVEREVWIHADQHLV